MENNLVDILINHRSVREFTKEKISDDQKKMIIDAAQMSPTSSYLQAYTIIEVTDMEKRKVLKEISGGQEWVEKAPVVYLFCADLHRIETLMEVDEKILENVELYTVAVVDASLAAQKAFIAAQSLGLGGITVGGIRNNMPKLSELFNLPSKVMPLFLLCLGHPKEERAKKPRLPQKMILGENTYPTFEQKDLISYDQQVSEFYNHLTKGVDQYSWIERCEHSLAQKPRFEVTDFVKKAGFLNLE